MGTIAVTAEIDCAGSCAESTAGGDDVKGSGDSLPSLDLECSAVSVGVVEEESLDGVAALRFVETVSVSSLTADSGPGSGRRSRLHCWQ